MSVAYVYDDRCLTYDWGPEHPLRMERLGLTEILTFDQGFDAIPDITGTEP